MSVEERRSELESESRRRKPDPTPVRAFSDYHSSLWLVCAVASSRSPARRRASGARRPSIAPPKAPRSSLSARRADRLEEIVGAHRVARRARAGGARRRHARRRHATRSSHAPSRRSAALDVMICNAGIGYHGPFDETPPAAMRRIVDVNLMGTLYAARAAMRAFRRQGRGHIIAVSSIVGRRGVGGSSVYAATKAAQIAFIESLRAEFVGTPFRASVVFPVGHGHRIPRGDRARLRPRGRAARDRVSPPSTSPRPSSSASSRRGPRSIRFARRGGSRCSASIAPAQADRVVQKFARRRKPVAAAPDAHRPS